MKLASMAPFQNSPAEPEGSTFEFLLDELNEGYEKVSPVNEEVAEEEVEHSTHEKSRPGRENVVAMDDFLKDWIQKKKLNLEAKQAWSKPYVAHKSYTQLERLEDDHRTKGTQLKKVA